METRLLVVRLEIVLHLKKVKFSTLRSLLYLFKVCLISSTVFSQLLFHHGTGTEQPVVLALVLDSVKFAILSKIIIFHYSDI